MSTFMDTGSVPDGKVDIRTLSAGMNPQQYLTAAEWNSVMADVQDLRDAVIAGAFFGLEPQTVRPTPPGDGARVAIVWLRSSDNHLIFFDGTTDHDLLAGGGGGGLTIAANQVAVGSGTNTAAGSAALTFDGSTLGLDFPTASSSGSPLHSSPVYRLRSRIWDGSADATFDYGLFTNALSSGNAALDFYSSYNSGSNTPMLRLQQVGSNHARVTMGDPSYGVFWDIPNTDCAFQWGGRSLNFSNTYGGIYPSGSACFLGDTGALFSSVGAEVFVGLHQDATGSGAVSIDTQAGEMCVFTPTGNVSGLTLVGGRPAQRFTLELKQAASATWPTTITNARLAGGAFSKTLTSGAVDTITFRWNATNSTWDETGRSLALA